MKNVPRILILLVISALIFLVVQYFLTLHDYRMKILDIDEENQLMTVYDPMSKDTLVVPYESYPVSFSFADSLRIEQMQRSITSLRGKADMQGRDIITLQAWSADSRWFISIIGGIVGFFLLYIFNDFRDRIKNLENRARPIIHQP